MPLDKEPKANREATKEALTRIIEGTSTRPLSEGPILVSDIPESAKGGVGVVMGIDEAGRGPVLGPMLYGAAFWNDDVEESTLDIPKGYNDSKQLNEATRSKLFEATLKSKDIGFVVRVLHATEISQNMLRKDVPYNLNAMSHDVAMEMVRAVLDAGVRVSKCYIDTVGREETYKARLDQVFAGCGIEFVVEKKADAKYKSCSAGSISKCFRLVACIFYSCSGYIHHVSNESSIFLVVAKVTRDRMIEHWKFTEGSHYEGATDLDYGSGYPSDPKCKAWMERHIKYDKLFMYPDLVRFSWGPVKDACKDKGVRVKWEADEQDTGIGQQQGAMKAFMAGEDGSKKKPRLAYFESRKLKRVTKLATN
jgi:ribonuclease H2 subunit A